MLYPPISPTNPSRSCGSCVCWFQVQWPLHWLTYQKYCHTFVVSPPTNFQQPGQGTQVYQGIWILLPARLEWPHQHHVCLCFGLAEHSRKGRDIGIASAQITTSSAPDRNRPHDTLNIDQPINLDNVLVDLNNGVSGTAPAETVLKSMNFQEKQSRIQPKFHKTAPWESARWRHLPRAIERVLHLLSNLWQQWCNGWLTWSQVQVQHNSINVRKWIDGWSKEMFDSRHLVPVSHSPFDSLQRCTGLLKDRLTHMISGAEPTQPYQGEKMDGRLINRHAW